MSSDKPSSYSKTSTARTLQIVQNASALTFSSFLIVHLAAPVAAIFGGESSASEFMVLGRVWYQGWLEPIVVYGAVVVHVSSGIAKRVLRRRNQAGKERELASIPGDVKKGGPVSTSMSLHSLTGYMLVPLVAFHSYTHRILPSSSKPPSNSLSPTFLTYSFVTYSISGYPVTSILSYALLTSAALYHAIAGIKSMDLRLRKKRKAILGGWKDLRGVWLAAVAGAGLGVLRIAQDGVGVPSWLARRYDGVLRAALYRL